MNRNVHSFPIPAHVRFKLCESGFQLVKDFRNITLKNLCKDLSFNSDANITEDEGRVVLSQIQNTSDVILTGTTTADYLVKESEKTIVTFSSKLDRALNGGIAVSRTTEICGLPGTGKTQFCLQLCVDVQICESLGGIGGEAIFVDTEKSFFPERLKDIAKGAVDHCQMIAGRDLNLVEDYTVDTILDHVYYMNCRDYVQLIAIINELPNIIEKHPKVRLVVIDSIAFHFRYGFDNDMRVRTRILSSLGQSLTKLATEKSIAVVWTNHMTTRFDCHQKSFVVPALGESWSHTCSVRLILLKELNMRKAFIKKSPNNKQETIAFQITTVGIRDTVEERILSDEQQIKKRRKDY